VSTKLSPEAKKIIGHMAIRAVEFDRTGTLDIVELVQTLCEVHEKYGLRLEDMSRAQTFDFFHDIYGITQNYNRETKELENCFSPRYEVNNVQQM